VCAAEVFTTARDATGYSMVFTGQFSCFIYSISSEIENDFVHCREFWTDPLTQK
jgi:hypothetical protein